MENYITQDNAFTNNAVILLERILTEKERLKLERILDSNLCRTIEHLSFQVKNVITLLRVNPRFDWVAIQNEIDECYTRDKNATGVVIYLDWKECEIGKEQRISINCKISKVS